MCSGRCTVTLKNLNRVEDLFITFVHGEAFENSVVGHGVDAGFGLLRVHMARRLKA